MNKTIFIFLSCTANDNDMTMNEGMTFTVGESPLKFLQ